jgi:peptidoglycan/xylan/chitin deacetylase (PgdA/CDA1 family)
MAGTGWRVALEQAGWTWRTAGPTATDTVRVTTGHVTAEQRAFVSGGGVLVVDAAQGGDGTIPSCTRTATVTGFHDPLNGHWVAAPGPVHLFDEHGSGTVRVHEDRVVKHGLTQGMYAVVHQRRIGAGWVIWTGLPLSTWLVAHGDRLRPVAPWSPVTERASTVDKAGVSDTLNHMIAQALESAGVPLVRRAAWPGGARSVLTVRVDVDGAFGDRARRLGVACARAGVRATFLLNRERFEGAPGDLGAWLDDHDVGQHAAVHDLYDTPEADLQNLEAGAAWVQSVTGREPIGFVAPRGMWSPSLDTALAELGYRWSSDFGLATETRPFTPLGAVLQIPVHAYSPERAVRWADETASPPPTADDVTAHYLRHLEDQVERGRQVHIYGHPEVLGPMAETVIPAIADRAEHLGLPRLTLDEIARRWRVREAAAIDATSHRDEDGTCRVDIIRTDARVPVNLCLPEPSMIILDGRLRRLPAGEHVLDS